MPCNQLGTLAGNSFYSLNAAYYYIRWWVEFYNLTSRLIIIIIIINKHPCFLFVIYHRLVVHCPFFPCKRGLGSHPSTGLFHLFQFARIGLLFIRGNYDATFRKLTWNLNLMKYRRFYRILIELFNFFGSSIILLYFQHCMSDWIRRSTQQSDSAVRTEPQAFGWSKRIAAARSVAGAAEVSREENFDKMINWIHLLNWDGQDHSSRDASSMFCAS